MKIAYYNVKPTEYYRIEKAIAEFGIEIQTLDEVPSRENLDFAIGCDCVTVRTTEISADIIQGWADRGIRFLSTRSIGTDHIDLEAAKRCGMSVSNTSYTQDSVANYAVMLILMLLRKMKYVIQRATVRDYSLPTRSGKNLANCTVGVIGTGRIGTQVIRNLSGFGCKILCQDPYPNHEAASMAEYVMLDRLLQESDIITLHAPALSDSYHLLNANAFAKMKPGVFIVNAARGTLLDTEALLEALESGHVAGAALDVLEAESELLLLDKEDQIIQNRTLSLLHDMPNVILTPHMAFDSEESMDDIVRNSILSCIHMVRGEDNPWRVL